MDPRSDHAGNVKEVDKGTLADRRMIMSSTKTSVDPRSDHEGNMEKGRLTDLRLLVRRERT